MSAYQLHRMLGITYKSAWFMAHRIRYAMTQPPLVGKLQGIVEADETYIEGKAHEKRGRGAENKTPVLALIERGGDARTFQLDRVNGKNLKDAIRKHVDTTAHIMTDSLPAYRGLEKEFASHETVDHGVKEYARGLAHVNTAEGYFSILKRGINGVYHHVSVEHLTRYLNEFSFRYDNRKVDDGERTLKALKATEGKRLTLRMPAKG